MRHNHSPRVLARQDEGSWLIVSEIYAGSRADRSYLNHSYIRSAHFSTQESS